MIAEPHIDQGDIGVGSGVLIMPGLQVLDYFDCFVLPSGDGVNVGEIGVECPIVSGKRDRSLKRCDCFIVHVLLRERLANLTRLIERGKRGSCHALQQVAVRL